MDPKRLGVGTLTIPDHAEKNILDVLKTGRLSYGPYIQEFERRFSASHGCWFGVMVNSGTSALQIAVACLAEAHNWQTGDEVIVPAVTFVATANVLIQQGFKPIFVDVDPKTYNIDPEQIEPAITPRTRAIMAVHLFGQPAEMEAVMEIAKKHDLRVIEDSCETMFSSHRGKSVGSMGDIGCFSSYVAHLIVTGVGGIAITNNPEYAATLRSLANHGRDGIYVSIDDDKGKEKDEFKQIVERRFRFIRNGYSYRVTEFEGAFGCAQLDIADEMLRVRRENASYLINALRDTEDHLQLPWYPEWNDHAFMMFPIVIKSGAPIKKSDLVMHLEERGIETRDMLPLVNQPFYQHELGIREVDYPVAEWINNNGFYIGCHQDMRPEELDYISETIHNFLKQAL